MWASVFWEMPTAGICSHLSTKGWVRSANDVRWRVLAQVLVSQFITEAPDVDEVRNRNNVSPLCSSKVWKTKSSKKDWRARGTQECRRGHHKPPCLQWTIHQGRVSAGLMGSSTLPRPTCLRQKHLSVTALLALWPLYTCSHLARVITIKLLLLVKHHWRFPTKERELMWNTGDGASLHHSGLQFCPPVLLLMSFKPIFRVNKTHSRLALCYRFLWTRCCNLKDNRNKLKVMMFTPAGDRQSSAEDHGTPPTVTFNQSDLLFNSCGNIVVWFIRRHFSTLRKTIVIYDKAKVTRAGNAGRAQIKAIGHFHNTGGERLKPKVQKVCVHFLLKKGFWLFSSFCSSKKRSLTFHPPCWMSIIIIEKFVCKGFIRPGWKNRDDPHLWTPIKPNDNWSSEHLRILFRLQIRKENVLFGSTELKCSHCSSRFIASSK